MPRLVRRMARTAAVVGTAAAVSNSVSHKQQAAQPAPPPADAAPPAEQQQPAAVLAPEAASQAAAEPVGVDTNDKLAQLKELGELKTTGVLTDAEFETQKQKILGS